MYFEGKIHETKFCILMRLVSADEWETMKPASQDAELSLLTLSFTTHITLCIMHRPLSNGKLRCKLLTYSYLHLHITDYCISMSETTKQAIKIQTLVSLLFPSQYILHYTFNSLWMVQNFSIARNIGNIMKRTYRLLKLFVWHSTE